MELVAVLRVLWRQRILVGLGGLAAIAAGLVMANGDVKHGGLASTRVVLDTPKSQLVDILPQGADTLGWRAIVLSSLMASEPLKEQVARDMRIRPARLVVVQPDLATPSELTPLAPYALDAVKAADEATADHVVTVRFSPELPIISIETHAPSRDAAARLAEAATQALRTAASTREFRGMQTVVAESLGAPQAKDIASRPSPLLAPGIAVALFAFWCAGLILVPGIARSLRRPGRVQPA